MDVGQAINQAKQGKKIARKGWNGKGMFLYYVPANEYPAGNNPMGTLKGFFENGLASQADLLADDWTVVD